LPAADLVDNLPPELGAVLDALLETDPGRRIGSAADALRALHALIPVGDEGLWPDWVTPLLAAAPVGAAQAKRA
jgi:hypothetical protein